MLLKIQVDQSSSSLCSMICISSLGLIGGSLASQQGMASSPSTSVFFFPLYLEKGMQV